MDTDPLVTGLTAAVGDAHVLTDPQVTAAYTTDFTRRFSGPARLVVRPADTAEVARVVGVCAEEGASIVPQGGNTGLVGGGVPRGGEVVLSLRRLASVERIDATAMQVTAGAGVPLAELQRSVRAEGLDFGVDFAARDSATIGGMIATNAGGERVLRYGTTRANVAGLEAVPADGGVLERLTGLPKDNTGYDLSGLLVGSEGTLAVITRARLRLVPRPTGRATALLALGSLDDAVSAVTELRALDSLELAEFFLADGLELVCRTSGLPAPFPRPYPVYLLVECAARHDPADELYAALDELACVEDAVVAVDRADRHRLTAYRERHTEAINSVGVPLKLDVSVPLTALAGFVEDLGSLLDSVATSYLFGHLAEGNLHVNLLGAGDRAEELTDAVLRQVAAVRGSISAEHGVGRAKARWLELSRSPTEIAAMRAVKQALDPRGLLNPGVLLPPGS
ncbi:FAD-binding oxidoreductase [Actinomadura alba]|uniref:FAD-binding oxidoreductase n=1 Tax=Actinomadura alba TaxID=406431 RepID=A0ABR7LYQ4_9ACTN|nr:FAD-binding oxidoreductase [Actinomadura alba]MBC6469914.1 FAD-binding oxidoreductase [Actinomadura alba]